MTGQDDVPQKEKTSVRSLTRSFTDSFKALVFPSTADENRPIWMVLHNEAEKGPYSAIEIKKEITTGRIDERTVILNNETGFSGALSETESFADYLAEFVTKREKRLRKLAQRKAKTRRIIRRMGFIGLLTTLTGLLFVCALVFYYLNYIRPKPEPLPFQAVSNTLTGAVTHSIFSTLPSGLDLPSYQSLAIEADPTMLSDLLALQAPIEHARPAPALQPQPSPPRDDRQDSAPQGPVDYGQLDFTQSSAPSRQLTEEDIRQTVAQHADEIEACVRSEDSRDEHFRDTGLITVQFVVHPDGRAVGVDLSPESISSELRRCITRVFRQLEFPPFNDLALPFSFPIRIR